METNEFSRNEKVLLARVQKFEICFCQNYTSTDSLFLFYILRNFVKMIAVLLILDKCNLYISQNTKFVKTKDVKIQYDTTPIERYNFCSLYGETSCFSI